MYVIDSYQGFNDINFGLSSQEIEAKLKKKPRKILKQINDKYETDAYDDFYVYYDEMGKCEAVEFNNNSELIFNQINLLKKNYHDVEKLLSSLDFNIEIDDVGFTSYKYGIGVYAPYKSELNAKIESVIIFRRGYYD
jgi:hypothetical protein